MFGAFCLGIEKLTVGQVRDLRQRLRTLDARLAVVSKVDARSEAIRCCLYCKAPGLQRWGATRSGLQRLRCKACKRTFCSATGTALDRIRSADKFHQVVQNMMRSQTPNSCRELANGLGINKMTAWRWRKRVMEALTGIGDTCLDGIVEADEKFFRESRKGSREWVNHERDPMAYPVPPRLQWYGFDAQGLPKPRGRSPWQMSVHTMTDRSGNRRADRLPRAYAERLKALLSQHIAPRAILCSDGERAYDQFAQQKGILHHRIYAKKGPRVIQNTLHIQTINNMHRRLEDFMRPFCGPATKNLSSYTAWFLGRIARNDGTADESAWSRMMAV